MGQVREKLAQVDDVAGTDEQLVQRLEMAKVSGGSEWIGFITGSGKNVSIGSVTWGPHLGMDQ